MLSPYTFLNILYMIIPFFPPRHKLINIRTIKSGNGLGQNGHCQETYPNLWTTLEGIMKMRLFEKSILCIGLSERDKQKNWIKDRNYSDG